MKSSYEERAKLFIQKLYPYICDCGNDCDNYVEAVGYFNLVYNRKVNVQYGATRVVFITSDYVIKIDCGDEDSHESFGNCESELALYNCAKDEGFDYLLAKITEYIYKSMRFYIMPRIFGIGRTYYDADYYMTPEEYRWCKRHHIYDLHNLNYGWKNKHICLIDYAAYDSQAPFYIQMLNI